MSLVTKKMKTEPTLRAPLVSVRMTATGKERATRHAEEKMGKVTSIHYSRAIPRGLYTVPQRCMQCPR